MPMQVVHHVRLISAGEMVKIVELQEDCFNSRREFKKFSNLPLQLRQPRLEFNKLRLPLSIAEFYSSTCTCLASSVTADSKAAFRKPQAGLGLFLLSIDL